MSTLRLTSSEFDPRGTVLTGSDGRVYYKTETHRVGIHEHTTVTRVDPADGPAPGSVVGNIDWHMVESDLISVAGATSVKAKDFLRASSHFTDSKGFRRTFAGPSGVEYSWHEHEDKDLKLFREEEDHPIAVFHPLQTHLWGKKDNGYMDVTQEGAEMLDIIILTWVWIERERRAKQGAEDDPFWEEGPNGEAARSVGKPTFPSWEMPENARANVEGGAGGRP